MVFDGAADEHIVIAVAPVGRQAALQPVDSLCEEIKEAVAALLHHRPAFRPPLVSVFQQEVGGETGEDDFPGGIL